MTYREAQARPDLGCDIRTRIVLMERLVSTDTLKIKEAKGDIQTMVKGIGIVISSSHWLRNPSTYFLDMNDQGLAAITMNQRKIYPIHHLSRII